MLQGIPGTDSIVLLADFNAHLRNDAQTWKGVHGKNGDNDANAQGSLLLNFCAGGRLSIMNTFFHHKYTWYRLERSPTQKSLIDLFVVSDDLRKSVMDVCVKRMSRAVDQSPPGPVQVTTGLVEPNANDWPKETEQNTMGSIG